MSFSIRNALIGIIGLLLLCTVGQGIFALRNMAEINANVEREAHVWLRSVNALEEISFDLIQLRVRQARHLLTTVDVEKTAIDAQIADVLKKLAADREDYEKLISSDDERSAYTEGMNQFNTYMASHDKLIQFSRKGDYEPGRAILNGELKKHSDLVLKSVRSALDIVRKMADADYLQSAQQYTAVQIFTWLAMVVVALAGLGAMWYAVFGISIPIRRVAETMGAIAEGALATER
jgi:methyl-accepting chemotaxis protein